MENVENRIEIQTRDMQELSFADGSFDVVLSFNVIHNVNSAAGRAKAIREIVLVLKLGGAVLIEDIGHRRAYISTSAAARM